MVELVPWGRLGMEFNEAFVKEIKRIAKLRVEVQVRSLLVSRGGISWEPPCGHGLILIL